MKLSQFRVWAVAQRTLAKYNDGQYPGECVSLINQYCYRVLRIPAGAWGHAKDWATNFAPLQYFDIVKGSIVEGDILVYQAAPYGHIEIYIGGGLSLQQNRFYDGLIGVNAILPGYIALRKKGQGGTTVTDVIKDADNEYGRWAVLSQYIRGRYDRASNRLLALSRKEFQASAVGRTWLKAIEILMDDTEARRNMQHLLIGKLAVADDWEGQINKLKTQVASLGKRPTQEQLNKVTATAKQLEQSVVDAKAEAKGVADKYDAALNELKKSQELDAEAQSFVSKVINIIRKFVSK